MCHFRRDGFNKDSNIGLNGEFFIIIPQLLSKLILLGSVLFLRLFAKISTDERESVMK